MNKVSSKLAAGMRKVKGQDEKSAQPVAAQAARTTETRGEATAPKSAPAISHPERVWPD